MKENIVTANKIIVLMGRDRNTLLQDWQPNKTAVSAFTVVQFSGPFDLEISEQVPFLSPSRTARNTFMMSFSWRTPYAPYKPKERIGIRAWHTAIQRAAGTSKFGDNATFLARTHTACSQFTVH